MKKRWNEDSPRIVTELREVVAGIEPLYSDNCERIVKDWISAKGLNTGAVLNLFRLIIVGALRGPHLFDIVEWIGRDETLRRLSNGVKHLSQQS